MKLIGIFWHNGRKCVGTRNKNDHCTFNRKKVGLFVVTADGFCKILELNINIKTFWSYKIKIIPGSSFPTREQVELNQDLLTLVKEKEWEMYTSMSERLTSIVFFTFHGALSTDAILIKLEIT